MGTALAILLLLAAAAAAAWWLWRRARLSRVGKCCGRGCGCLITPPPRRAK
ncbi:MAG: hypothetical protein JJU00_16455 [Opitutales bacterium]|nr:hypothetical protein [Opitutales bacterium]